eukprot:TRINITY_DN4640_c0_g1_i1.p1 TRINITY_DN4640_c0_g1~~TRINITY_DN4640_c0_g1_i1.p1  ORF type:complete len:556 (+),score=95.58 TRINITY_DN4640_c0_g1_i1:56-1723(+)
MASKAASYAETSRLSFLGTWKNRLREIVSSEMGNPVHDPMFEAELRAVEEESDGLDENFVFHIDVDCFFVSAARAGNPSLQNIPVAVTSGGDSHSDICTASYEARKFGVRKGMLLSKARLQCPHLSIVRTSPELFKKLNDITRVMYRVFLQYSTDIHPLSCDELLMRVPKRYSKNVIESGKILRQMILKKTGCPVSIGIGLSSIMARLSTQFAKPPGEGVHQLQSLRDLPVRSLTGVGRVMEQKLSAANITKCQHISQTDEETLKKLVGGVLARKLQAMASGQEASDIQFGVSSFLEQKPQSISRNLNWAIRPNERSDVDVIIRDICSQVHHSFVSVESKPIPHKVTLKLLIRAKDAPEPLKRFGHGKVTPWTASSSYRLGIAESAIEAFSSFNGQVDQIRGIGVTLHLKYKHEDKRVKDGCNTIDRFLHSNSGKQPSGAARNKESKPVEMLVIDDDDDDDDDVVEEEEFELFHSSDSSIDDVHTQSYSSPTQFFCSQSDGVKRFKTNSTKPTTRANNRNKNTVTEVIDIDALPDSPKRRKQRPANRKQRDVTIV